MVRVQGAGGAGGAGGGGGGGVCDLTAYRDTSSNMRAEHQQHVGCGLSGLSLSGLSLSNGGCEPGQNQDRTGRCVCCGAERGTERPAVNTDSFLCEPADSFKLRTDTTQTRFLVPASSRTAASDWSTTPLRLFLLAAGSVSQQARWQQIASHGGDSVKTT